jgi:hypothetical protein
MTNTVSDAKTSAVDPHQVPLIDHSCDAGVARRLMLAV